MERSRKRARRADVGDVGEAMAPAAAPAAELEPAAGEAHELSALEALHDDVLEAILLRLGPAEAWRCLRPVSRKLRDAVDRVAWPSLQLKASTDATIRLAAACFAQSSAGAAPRIRLAAGASLELTINCSTLVDMYNVDAYADARAAHACAERCGAVSSLFFACSASSGGLSSVDVRMIMSSSMKEELIMSGSETRIQLSDFDARIVSAMLRPLGVSEAEGGSCNTLRSISVQLEFECVWGPLANGESIPDPVRLLSRFPRLERLKLPFILDHALLDGAAAAAALRDPAALPALRSAVIRLHDAAALAALAEHPALEELELSMEAAHDLEGSFGFFAQGPAARRLRKLNVNLPRRGPAPHARAPPGRAAAGAGAGPPPVVTTLPRFQPAAGPPFAYAYKWLEALAELHQLRRLDIFLAFSRSPSRSGHLQPSDLRCLARAFTEHLARSLVGLHLELRIRTGYEPGVDAALAELLRITAPALVDLGVGAAALRGEAAAALAACPRLRGLHLERIGPESSDDRDQEPEPVPVAAAVDVLAACPALEHIACLVLPIDNEWDATEGLEPLRRLGAARPFASASSFILRPGHSLEGDHDEQTRLLNVAKERLLSAFPKADVVNYDNYDEEF
eukprot:tig00000806_g4378.t1